MWDPNRSTPFDPSAYPEIVHIFFDLTLSWNAAHKLRKVSKAYRHLVNRALTTHIKIRPVSRKAGVGLAFVTPVPWIPAFYESQAPSEVTKADLEYVQVLDICAEKTSYEHVPTETFVKLIRELAPHLVNLKVVRQYMDFRPGFASSFDATTLQYSSSSSLSSANITNLNICLEFGFTYPYEGPTGLPVNFPSNVETVNIYLNKDVIAATKGDTPGDGATSDRQGATSGKASKTEKLLAAVLDINWLIQRDHYKVVIAHDYDMKAFKSRALSALKSLLTRKGVNKQKKQAIKQNFSFVTVDGLHDLIGDKEYNQMMDSHGSWSGVDVEFHCYLKEPTFNWKPFRKLETAFLAQEDAFTASGTVEIDDQEGMGIYLKDANGTLNWLNVPLNAEQAETLYNAGAPSPFGRGTELVYDESYRSARQIMPRDFALAGDILTQGSILHRIQVSLDTEPLYATISKVNIYAKGGMFKAHRDTPRGNNHIGTLTLCLPSPFSGGELVVSHSDQKQVFDWASEAGAGQNVIPWTFLFSDSEHEVLPVTFGMRVTIAYDVFVIPEDAVERIVGVAPHREAADALKEALENRHFLPFGGILAFGLTHKYATAPEHGEDFTRMLKGVDRTWREVLREAGLSHELVAVYWMGGEPQVRHDMAYKSRTYPASRYFYAYQHEYVENEGRGEYNYISEIPVKNIHWITEPNDGGIMNTYASYGNEVETSFTYVAVAIYAYIGLPGDRSSGTPQSILHTGFENDAPSEDHYFDW